MCSSLCKECNYGATSCSACWDFFSNNLVNELYETCVEKCGLGTYYNAEKAACSFCNPVCLLCEGSGANECTYCNKTPEARQLYLYENECRLSCPRTYTINTQTKSCERAVADFVSFSFMFMILAFILALATILISRWLS